MSNTSNFVSLQDKKRPNKIATPIFSPKVKTSPLKSVYKEVNKVQYSRTIIINKKEKND